MLESAGWKSSQNRTHQKHLSDPGGWLSPHQKGWCPQARRIHLQMPWPTSNASTKNCYTNIQIFLPILPNQKTELIGFPSFDATLILSLYYTLANRKGRKLPIRSALVVQTRIKTLWEGAEAWQRRTSYDKPPGYQLRHHFASILTGRGCNFLHFASRNDTTFQHLGEQFWNHARTHCYCKQGSGGTASCGKVFWYRSCTCQTSQVVVTSRKRTYTV